LTILFIAVQFGESEYSELSSINNTPPLVAAELFSNLQLGDLE
jgi:hypothetical protein